MTELNAAAVAKMIDHTILKTDATPADDDEPGSGDTK